MNYEIRLSIDEMRKICGKKYCHAVASWFFRKTDNVLESVYGVYLKAKGEVDDAGFPYVFKRVKNETEIQITASDA
jgi:hypothetical protein